MRTESDETEKQLRRRKRRRIMVVRFVLIFLVMAFAVTCSFILFFTFSDIDIEHIYTAAPLTFGNVIFMALLLTLLDRIWRYFTVTRPIRRIQDGLDEVIGGDFSVQIDYVRREDSGNEFDEIIAPLNRMIQELNSVETLRTDFVSNVSHELKTPLAVIQNYATLLSSPELSAAERQDYTKRIADQTARLSSLVTNILRLNKLENQQIFPEFSRIDLTESVCKSMLNFEEVWEEKSLEIETEFSDDVYVWGDEEMLSLVWNNLMSNAVKFTDEHGRIRIETGREEDHAFVRISDSGCGMDEETSRNIFRKFYQGDTSHAMQGNGLGLAMVQRVVEIHGGGISVDSRPGEGSSFTVRLKQD